MILAPKYLARLTATVGLFTRYGLADFAQQQGLPHLPPETPGAGDRTPSQETAAAFRARLVELGPAYIKLGQVLSTRPDLLPAVYIRELEKLQDEVEPVPVAEVMDTIERELGARMSKLFHHFDPEPLATASLGQVHAAQLRGGRDVVVKVQRPNIRRALSDDVAFFRELAEFLTAHTHAGRRLDLVGIIEQLERALADELDYRIEARNTAHFREALAKFPRLLVPKVVEAYSTERVLTTERIRGIKIDEIPAVTRPEHDFTCVADELTRAYLKQITIDGHFHADPHPGNVFVAMADRVNPATPSEIVSNDRRLVPRPGVTKLERMEARAQRAAPPEPGDIDVRLALIDFGMTARLSVTARELCVRLLMGLADNRGEDVAEALMELGEPLPDFERATFIREISALVGRNYRLDVGEVQAGTILYEMIALSFQRGLRLPSELTLLAKTLVSLDAVTRALDPAFDPIDSIRDFMNDVAADRARKNLNPRKLYRLATESADFISALPHRLDLITARMANNEFQTRLDVPQITGLLQGLQKVANRIFSGLVLAAIIVASAMLMPYQGGLGTWGFGIAGALALYMVISILWSDRHKDAG